jgi:hypothetical protein
LKVWTKSREAATAIALIFGPNVCDSAFISPQHGHKHLSETFLPDDSASWVLLQVSTSVTVLLITLTLEEENSSASLSLKQIEPLSSSIFLVLMAMAAMIPALLALALGVAASAKINK